MSNALKKSLVAMLVMAPLLAACPASVPGTTPVGQAKLAVAGNVIKGTAPFPLATVRLIEKVNNDTRNREVQQTDNIGNFAFKDVPAGTYRVAFDRADLAQVRDKVIVYNAANSDTFGFYTTNEFVISGNETATKTIPPMNVLWTANVNPAPDGIAAAPVTFTWSPAPGAQSYKIRIANPANNTVFTSETLQASATSYTWDGKASGAKVPAGAYIWSVNVDLLDGSGGTNVSKFTLQ